MEALVIVIFVREVSHITPLTNSILLISRMMNLILTLTFIAGMVIDQHPTCVPCDPRTLALYSGWTLLALFIQLHNKWEGIKKKCQVIIHFLLTENVLWLFHMLNLPVMQQCMYNSLYFAFPEKLHLVWQSESNWVVSAQEPRSEWHVESQKMLLTSLRLWFFCNYVCNC